MPRPNRIQQDAPIPLRRNTGSPVFTDEQLLIVAAFFTALIQGGIGVYSTLNNEGNAIRIKLYRDNQQYADTINNQEDIEYLLHDYADQMKVLPIYQALVGKLHAATAPAAPGAPAKRQQG